MPRFAANLSMLWTELEPFERFRAAAEAGFKRVEMLFPHELDADTLTSTLRDLDLEMVLFDPAPGDWAGGERGLLCLPGREEEFLQTVRDAIALAARLGTPKLNALAGLVPPGVAAEQSTETAASNLRAAAQLVEAAHLTLLVESINSVDVPGYLADTAEKAVALVESAASPAVRFQLDQYHVAMSGADATEVLHRYYPVVGHVQVADVPGRHQPGTGQQAIEAFLSELDALGYAGSVGLEYRPLGTTEESLAWLGGRHRA